MFAINGHAAQDSFDIDLKELRPAPARPAGSGRDAFDIELKELKQTPVRRETSPRHHRPAQPESAPEAGHESSYTVRSGDNLFLILIRQYGLSNSVAERLIPEIVRRNDISDPQKLTLGQRLIIPLAGTARTTQKTGTAKAPPAAQPVPPVVQAPGVETVQERVITVEAAAPCLLARNLARELGLQIPSLSPLLHTDSASIGYDDQKLIVACSLTPAEAYTHERLLSSHGIQLLVFNGEVPPRRVVEELADRLGIDFHLASETASDELPVTYLFPAADPAEKGTRLTIVPAPVVPKP